MNTEGKSVSAVPHLQMADILKKKGKSVFLLESEVFIDQAVYLLS